MSDPRIIVALDFPGAGEAVAFARRLTPQACRLKVGMELYTAAGPRLIDELQALGFELFLDLKFHDIPNTVARACKAAAALGIWMLNVHALGGRAMLSAAREALPAGKGVPKLIAVTVLTSMADADLNEVGIAGNAQSGVLRLAALAKASGLDGVVCSPLEAAALKAACGRDFLLVTPGIRASTAAGDDQKRVMTAASALAAGAHYLVIGRPITAARDPVAALNALNREITGNGQA